MNAPRRIGTVPGDRGTPAADLVVAPELVRSLVSAHHPDLALPQPGSRCRARCPCARARPRPSTRSGGASCRGSTATRVTSRHPRRRRPPSWDASCGRCTHRRLPTRRSTPTAASRSRGGCRASRNGSPPSPSRGGAGVRGRPDAGVLGELVRPIDTGALRALAHAAADAPGNRVPVRLHVDLHPRNLLVREGRVVAVLDWGDVTAGDPATDLASAWMLFDGPGRAASRTAYGDADDLLWRRARAWAGLFGAALLVAGPHDDDRVVAVGTRTLSRVLDDEEFG